MLNEFCDLRAHLEVRGEALNHTKKTHKKKDTRWNRTHAENSAKTVKQLQQLGLLWEGKESYILGTGRAPGAKRRRVFAQRPICAAAAVPSLC